MILKYAVKKKSKKFCESTVLNIIIIISWCFNFKSSFYYVIIYKLKNIKDADMCFFILDLFNQSILNLIY